MASSEKQIEKKQAIKRFNRMVAYKKVFSTVDGKEVLRDLMRTHFMLSTTFVEGKPDLTSHNDGERDVVIRILKIMQIDLSGMQKYIEEIEKDARSDSSDPTQWPIS